MQETEARLEKKKIKREKRNTIVKAETKVSENVIRRRKNAFSFQILCKNRPSSENLHHCYIRKLERLTQFQANFET